MGAVDDPMPALWAGPYLNGVHGLDGVARGNVPPLTARAMIVGAFPTEDGAAPERRRAARRLLSSP